VNNPYVHILDFKPATLFRAAFQDGLQNRPLSNLSLALNYYFGRLDPFGYHVVNFVFFCLTALGIWLLLVRLFIRLGFDPARSELAAWLSALLWTSHPLNTQAVTYIVQRHTSFAGAFSIWSIYFFHLGLEAKKRRLLLFMFCGLCGILAILCKETALTLPVIIFLYKIYFFDELKPGWVRSNSKWIIALAIFYALAAAFALRPAMLARMTQEFASHHISAWGKFLSTPRSLLWYLYLILFPFPQFLSFMHDFPLSTGLFHPFTTLVSWAAFLAVVAVALARARSWRIFSFVVMWYLCSLAVEAMPLPIDLVNDHRLYLALLSLIVPACSWPVLKWKSLKLALPWAMVVALFFGFFTFSRNRVWTSDDALWGEIHQKSPESAAAYNDLGNVYSVKGQLDLAIQDYNKAIEIDPKLPDPYNGRGNAYTEKGQFDLAIHDYSKAIELDPKLAVAYFNRGLAYAVKGRLDLAVQDFNKAIEFNPKGVDAYNNRGNAYQAQGQLDLAMQDYNKAMELDPKDAQAYLGRGAAYYLKGQFDLAMHDYSKAIELDPQLAQAYAFRGNAYTKKGQFDLALQDFSKAIELNPQSAEPYYDRGLVYKAKGQPELAKKDFDKAIALDSQFAAWPH
jgi:tetratricopeptide (TPR) repeat protein